MSFVKINDRVSVYCDPRTRENTEGDGQVVAVHWCDDVEAMVDVLFDGDDSDYPRRVTKECVL